MAKFHYDIPAAGIPAGYEKTLPDSLAAELVRLGIGHIIDAPKAAVSAPLKAKTTTYTTQPVKAAKSAPKAAKKQSK